MSNGVMVISRSPEETAGIAKRIAAKLRGGETLALIGKLGSGKTTFVKALAKALGVREPVRSPTFVLMVPYQCKRKQISKSVRQQISLLLHVDAYRVKNARELEAIGIRDYLGRPDTVTVIEWADHVRKLLPRKTKTLKFAHAIHVNERTIKV